jgi:phosphotransferase system HPr-like phosphotransfer protein
MDSILLDYADAVVMKTNDVRADAQAVLANLLALREKYKELQPPPPAPSHANGWTVCEATCHLSSGLGLLAIGAIREEVEKADRAARLAMISPEGVAKEVDCKSAYEVATLFVFEGARLRLSIEGTDDLAERAARRIYGILTSRFACNLRPERFEQAPTPAPGG